MMRTNIHTTKILFILLPCHMPLSMRESVRERVKGSFIRRLLIT